MQSYCEEVGIVAALYFHHECVGIIPTSPITRGDYLVYCDRKKEKLVLVHSAKICSMQVCHRDRRCVLPGERCAIGMNAFNLKKLKRGMFVYRVESEPTSNYGFCHHSPTGRHFWFWGYVTPYSNSNEAEYCICCGKKKKR